jgi:hypothetical protein
MGYTQYFKPVGKKNPTKAEWRKFLVEVRGIIENCDVPLRLEFDVDDPPRLDDDAIVFNGVGNDGHETFMLERVPSRREGRCLNWFCKTARKPYDAVVVAVLAAAKRRFPWWLSLSSDGDGEQERTYDNPTGLLFPYYDKETWPLVKVKWQGSHFNAQPKEFDFSAAVGNYFAGSRECRSDARMVAFVLRCLADDADLCRWLGFNGYSFDEVSVTITHPGQVPIHY